VTDIHHLNLFIRFVVFVHPSSVSISGFGVFFVCAVGFFLVCVISIRNRLPLQFNDDCIGGGGGGSGVLDEG
jgi:hypothetical protein